MIKPGLACVENQYVLKRDIPMSQDNSNDQGTLMLLCVSAFLMLAGLPDIAVCDQVPKLGVVNSTRTVPNNEGFIQRWLILEPIRAVGDTQQAGASGESQVSGRFDQQQGRKCLPDGASDRSGCECHSGCV